jgi:hypothetical protein
MNLDTPICPLTHLPFPDLNCAAQYTTDLSAGRADRLHRHPCIDAYFAYEYNVTLSASNDFELKKIQNGTNQEM